MWNEPLVKPPPKKAPPKAKPKTVKKKAKPKPRAASTTKLVKDIAMLKELTKAQGVTIAHLSKIVTTMQLGDIDKYSVSE